MTKATTAVQLKDEALKKVAQGRELYIAQATLAAKRHLRKNSTITSQNIRHLAPVPDGMEPRVLGAIMLKLVRDLNLTLVEYRPTKDRRSHCRPIAVWGKKDGADS